MNLMSQHNYTCKVLGSFTKNVQDDSLQKLIYFYLRVFALTRMDALMSRAHGAQERPFADK